MNKRGISLTIKILIAIAIIVVVIVGIIFFFLPDTWKQLTSIETSSSTTWDWKNVNSIQKFTDFSKTKILQILGFERGFLDSFKDLFIGFIAGFYICLIYFIATKVEKIMNPGINETDLKIIANNSWLKFAGNQFWKAIPIGMFYFILNQIPFIKVAIQIITFEPLMIFKDTVAYFIVKPLIVAFVLGMGPAAIEAYSTYKLRKKYRGELLKIKANKAAIEALRSS